MYYYFKALQNYAAFSGRASRKEYWMFFLFNMLIIIALSFIDVIVDPNTENGLFSSIYQLAVMIPWLAVAVRRMHDVNKNGWFIFIPIYNLILTITEGDAYNNEYGPPPND